MERSTKEVLKGIEFDALRHKRYFHWEAGDRKKAKQSFNLRIRRQFKQRSNLCVGEA